MPKVIVQKRAKQSKVLEQKNVQNGWGKILADAQVALREHKTYGRALKRSIKIVQSKIAAGVECPEYLFNESTHK
jgi:hypothetical protein